MNDDDDDGKVLKLVPREMSLEKRKSIFGECEHWTIIVDEELAEAECEQCKAKLSPMGVLGLLMRREAKYAHLVEHYRKVFAEKEYRSKAKCECGKWVHFELKPRKVEA